nr:selenocysteine-specific translation elongation factor [Haloechinothrix aidingensis]
MVRELTGMEPDRLAEERRRALTVDLGFVWTELDGRVLAFVDVPGHERFVANMLTGVGPVTAVLFVVSAEEGWQAQSTEHLAALDAFGVRHGLLVVTKSDRAEAEPVLRDARERIARTSLGHVPALAVSAHSGAGLDRLREELVGMVGRLPPADREADVRLWVDRSFTVRGAGTVITGTLGAGTLRVGDELALTGSEQRAAVRGLQSLGRDRAEVAAVARVAVNLRGVGREHIQRGHALLTPGAWRHTTEVDARVRDEAAADLHRDLVLHIGAAAVPCRVRALGTDTVRLALAAEVPLAAGDTGLLRDPGEHRIPAGVEVLDAHPPRLRGRGAAAARAAVLDAGEEARAYVRRHGAVPVRELEILGWQLPGSRVGDWAVDDDLLAGLPARVSERVTEWASANPLAAGMPIESLRKALGVPGEVLSAVLPETGLDVQDGRVRRPGAVGSLPEAVERAVRDLESSLAEQPFRAPEAGDLAALGLGARELAAAERAGRLVRIADGVVLTPDALHRAARELTALDPPFTVSEVRRALGTTRRVAVPLLERLDGEGVTERLPDNTRRLAGFPRR